VRLSKSKQLFIIKSGGTAAPPPLSRARRVNLSIEERSLPPRVFRVWLAAVSAARRVPAEFRAGVRY